MVDFTLTEEQQSFQDTVRKFAEKEIKPIAADVDRIQDPKDTWSLVGPVIKKGLQLGFGKMLLPEEYGGMGWGQVEVEILAEELGAADAGIAMSVLINGALPNVVALVGSKGQQERWVRPSGEDETGKHIWAGAFTEPSGGNEITCPLPDPAFGVRTTATRDGKGYRIKGQKCFITNAGVAENYFVLARTEKEKSNLQGCTLFVFHRDTPGYAIGKIEDKLGCRGARNGEIFFDDMWVPEEDMIGEEGAGLSIAAQVFKGNGIAMGGILIGVARAAYNCALNYAQERVIWGRPIIQYDSVASKLTRMRMKIEACKNLVWKIAWSIDNPGISADLDKLSSMAKVYSSEMAVEVVNDAMYIHGGYGYMKDYPIEKYLRDSLHFRTTEGANDTVGWFMSFDLQPM